MAVLFCYVTGAIVDAFCDFLLSGYIQKKLSSFNPTSKVSHMQQNNVVCIIAGVLLEPIKKAQVLIILMVR